MSECGICGKTACLGECMTEEHPSPCVRELNRLRTALRIAHQLCLSSAPKQAVGEVLATALAETLT